jgi:hypothetical protein
VSVVSQLREERTNLVNGLRHVDEALSILGRLNGGRTGMKPTRTFRLPVAGGLQPPRERIGQN